MRRTKQSHPKPQSDSRDDLSPSLLARKHAILCNPPVGVKKSKGVTLKSDPKSISPSYRLKEFPDRSFRVNYSTKLFCDVCREVLSCKKSSIEIHIKTKKHKKGKEYLKLKAVTEMDIAQALRLFDKEQHPVGKTLSESVVVYSVKMLMAMLKSNKYSVLGSSLRRMPLLLPVYPR